MQRTLQRMRLVLATIAVFLAAAGPAHAGGPAMLVGATEDAVRQPSLAASKAKFDLARLVGFDSVRITSYWTPGQTEPTADERASLETVAAAARLSGVRVLVTVMHPGSRTTPLTDEAREQFAAYAVAVAQDNPSFRDFVIANEPNLNRFWMPQFNPDGSDAAAPAYLQLLTLTYDALKAVSPRITVYGLAISPRGSDRAGTIRDTHSPTAFIRDLGAAYRASGRTRPIMDALSFHPYPDSSNQPPSKSAHPKTTSIGLLDYDKLVGLLGEAFDGTAQPGSTLPILYSEYAFQTQIPEPKQSLYTGLEPATTTGTTEANQAAYYREALQIVYCQPTVIGLLFFHVEDEADLDRWQSGVFYADGTPKSSLTAVRTAVTRADRGILARCPDLKLTPRARRLRPPVHGVASGTPVRFTLDCDIDCAYTARLQRLPAGRAVQTKRGRLAGKTLKTLSFPRRRLSPGLYRISVSLLAPVNPGPPGTRSSVSFRIR
jgi:hypothetical protein